MRGAFEAAGLAPENGCGRPAVRTTDALSFFSFCVFAFFQPFFVDRKAETAKVASQRIVMSVRIGDKPGFFQIKASFVINIGIVNVDGDNFGQKHVMCAVIDNALDLALN